MDFLKSLSRIPFKKKYSKISYLFVKKWYYQKNASLCAISRNSPFFDSPVLRIKICICIHKIQYYRYMIIGDSFKCDLPYFEELSNIKGNNKNQRHFKRKILFLSESLPFYQNFTKRISIFFLNPSCFFSSHFNTTFIFDRLIGQLDGWKLTLQDVGSYLQD